MKRVKTSHKSKLRNRQVKSTVKTALKKVLEQKSKENALPSYKNYVSMLDKAVKKGVIHRNKASRAKSQACRFIKTLT
jgi:small subunit ribosomal protein S20